MNDAALAATLLALDASLGGMVVRGDGASVLEQLAGTISVRRMPAHIDRERLLGGLDLSATLATGRPVKQSGLLEESSGGAVIVPMAERIETDIAGVLCAALDAGDVRVVLLDSGMGDEMIPAALLERVAFIVDDSSPRVAGVTRTVNPVRGDVHVCDEYMRAIATAAAALGVLSPRASLFTLRTAKGLAAIDQREVVREDDIVTAIRLVLMPRATQWPEAQDETAPPPDDHQAGDGAGEQSGPLADTVLEAVAATLPPGLLDMIRDRAARGQAKGRGGGAKRKSPMRGRPVGVKAGLPRGGARLALLDTLRAAAPWQKLRAGDSGAGGRIAVRKADLRVRRFKSKTATTTIFAVDASGSAAAARMAEAKGAVELLLTQAYVKRAQVALVAFRGDGAETILPPTRSLTRARRLLAELPGGGGTPIAAGLDAARVLALSERTKDRMPQIIVLTDGRANVPSDGTAQASAERAAKAIARDSLAATLIDISARPRTEGRALAEAMGGRYVALPRGSATDVSRAIG
jgi:magnesium chelatase subunit D